MSLQPCPKMLYQATNQSTKFPQPMITGGPVEVGTRGTVGSLLMKELEYFRKLKLDHCIREPQGNSWPGLGFLSMNRKRNKKRRSSGGGGVLPSICSVVEVAESHHHQLKGIHGFSYRNLRAEIKRI